jgi:Domain of unknown function (DUF4124)
VKKGGLKNFCAADFAELLYGNLKTKRGKLAMWKSVCVLFFALFVAPSASAEIFKCVGKKGEALYQNFPCEFDSMGGMSTDVPSPKKSPTDVSAPKKSPAVPAEPRVGMTTDEVRAIWGDPVEIVQEEPGDGGRVQVWSYSDSRSVRFDRKRRVAAIQQ